MARENSKEALVEEELYHLIRVILDKHRFGISWRHFLLALSEEAETVLVADILEAGFYQALDFWGGFRAAQLTDKKRFFKTYKEIHTILKVQESKKRGVV